MKREMKSDVLLIFIVFISICTVSCNHNTSNESIETKNKSISVIKEHYVNDGYKDEVLFSGFHTNILYSQANARLDSLSRIANSNFCEHVYQTQPLGRQDEMSKSTVREILYYMKFENGKSIYFKITLNSSFEIDSKYWGSNLDKRLSRYLNSITLTNSSYENDEIQDILKLYKKKYGRVVQKKGTIKDLFEGKTEFIKYYFPNNKNVSITFEKYRLKYYPGENIKTKYIISIKYLSTRLIEELNKAERKAKQQENKLAKKVVEDI